jgi:hypothetical protein
MVLFEAFKITWALLYIVWIIMQQKYKLLFSYYQIIFLNNFI